MYDFYQQQMGMTSPYQVTRVNGANGANAYRLPPNSSVLLLDETAPLVWLAQTDGAGYKTVTPYRITPYEPEPEPDFNSLEERIKKLEEMMHEPNHGSTKRKSAVEE